MQNQNTYKIYSRKRFAFNSNNNLRRKKFRKRLKRIMPFLSTIIIIFIIFYMTWNAIDPIFETLCKDEAKSIATKITNEQSTKIIKQHDYNDFFSIQKDDSGNIKMISANTLSINEITSDIALNIQNELNKESENEVQIALGSATGVKMLSGFGPNVSIKIMTAGNIDTNLKSEFVAQSINQTLHRVYLEIDCNVNILTPFTTIEDHISNQILLAENVILGEIPSSYYNLEGFENSKETLEIIK